MTNKPAMSHVSSLDDTYAWMLIVTCVVAFISLTLSLQAGFFSLLFSVIAWWVCKHPNEGFLLFVIIAPILPMFKITQTIGTITLVKDIIILVLFFRLFIVPLLQKKLPYRKNILVAPLFALLLWSILATVRADSLILGILRLRDIALYLLLYTVTLYLPWTKQYARRVITWFLCTAAVVMLLGYYQWFFAGDSAVLRFDPVRSLWIPRISSILAHPSIFGQYLILVCTVLIGLFISYADKSIRITSACMLLAAWILIFMTYSRAVWIGMSVSLIACLSAIVIAYLISFKKIVIRYNVILLLIAVIIISSACILRFTPAAGLIRSAIDPTYKSNEERLTFLSRLVAPITAKEAIIGKGLGDVIEQNFRIVDLDAYDIASASSRAVQLTKNKTLVDNQHLKTFVEMGVIGIVLYFWVYWRVIVNSIHVITTSMHTDSKNKQLKQLIGLLGFGYVSAFIIQGLFIDIWDIFPTNASFWVVAAIVSIASSYKVIQYSQRV